MGATSDNHTCAAAVGPPYTAVPIDLAGLNDPFDTGIAINATAVRVRPITSGVTAVARRVTISTTATNTPVVIASTEKADQNPKPPGDSGPHPVDAKPDADSAAKRPLAAATRAIAPPPTTAPTTCAATYGGTSRQRNRPAVASPTVTAGLQCPPDTGPNALAPTNTLMPSARATPTNPDPRWTSRNPVSNSAVPATASTRNAVPAASASSRCATGGRPCSSTSLVLVRSGIVSAPPSGGRKARWSERRGVALLLLASIDPTGV